MVEEEEDSPIDKYNRDFLTAKIASLTEFYTAELDLYSVEELLDLYLEILKSNNNE